MRKKKVWIASGIILVLAVMIGVSVFRQVSAKAPSVETVSLKNEKLSSELMIPGTVKLQSEQIVYSSPEKGKVKEVMVKEGQDITKDTVLVKFENPETELEAEKNNLAIETSYLKINQTKKQLNSLYEKKKELGSGEEADAAKKEIDAQIEQLETENKMAELDLKQSLLQKEQLSAQLEELEVKSKIDGKVFSVNEGTEPLAEGEAPEPIVHAGKLEDMIITGFLSEFDTLKVKAGQKVKIKTDALPDKHWEGEIKTVATLPQQSQEGEAGGNAAVQYKVTAVVMGNTEMLKPGFQVIMEIVTESKEGDLLPVDAVMESNGKQYVYIVKNGTVKKKKVETGMATGDKVEIVKGLSEKDKVANGNLDRLKDGMEVNVR
ncbi:efflux RND transporter periplasmic adaptor subunit [Bacillus massilinigeriensis]|uniref:efflux RND transporter periplasmic adaptor subunit n=1 Tax=Bacillus mediterraneensis TaxID=1805474 RepID=UPI0008F7EE9D|nr:efflux RND transporter periplasmic adaptor subunit [Bacillus mediterraneensis]